MNINNLLLLSAGETHAVSSSSHRRIYNINLAVNPVGKQDFPDSADFPQIIGYQKFLSIENVNHNNHSLQ